MVVQEQLKETGLEQPPVPTGGQPGLFAATKSAEGTSRLEAFSDGVFFIAITLLVPLSYTIPNKADPLRLRNQAEPEGRVRVTNEQP